MMEELKFRLRFLFINNSCAISEHCRHVQKWQDKFKTTIHSHHFICSSCVVFMLGHFCNKHGQHLIFEILNLNPINPLPKLMPFVGLSIYKAAFVSFTINLRRLKAERYFTLPLYSVGDSTALKFTIGTDFMQMK